MKLGIIGCGHLGKSLVKGIIASSQCSKEDILVSAQSDSSRKEISEKYGWRVAQSNLEVVQFADMIIIAVRPRSLDSIFQDQTFRESFHGKLVISVVTGVSLDRLRSYMQVDRLHFMPSTRLIIRCMANVACSVQHGMLTFCSDPNVPVEKMQTVMKLFSCLGRCRVLEERYFDVITALSASSPAFFGLIADAMVDGGVLMGLPRNLAIETIMQAMLGTAKLVLNSQSSNDESFSTTPSQLKDTIMTPAGCTAAGVHTMELGSIRATLMDTVVNCTERAEELGRML